MLARCIFTPSLAESRRLLQEHIFSPHMPLTRVQLVLERPLADEDVDYARRLLDEGVVDGFRADQYLTQECALRTLVPRLPRGTRLVGQEVIPVAHDRVATTYEDHMIEMGRQLLNAPAPRQTPVHAAPAPELPPELAGLLEEDAAEEEQPEEEEEEEEEPTSGSLAWRTPVRELPPDGRYTWAYTVWLRINGASLLLEAHQRTRRRDPVLKARIEAFVEAHLRCAQLIDALDDPSDTHVDAEALQAAYQSLGRTQYESDLHLARWSEPRVHQLRPEPLQVLQQELSSREWDVERLAHQIRAGTERVKLRSRLLGPDGTEWAPWQGVTRGTHSMYLAMVAILNQCMQLLLEGPREGALRRAAWTYYASFVDLFVHCERMDDAYLLHPLGAHRSARTGELMMDAGALSPWLMWGPAGGTRIEDADDLPDLGGMLSDIPLYGQLRAAASPLIKIYQKSLPFACQRRHLIRLVTATIQDVPSFWPLFSRLAWVALADLYWGPLAAAQQRLGMRDLVRIRQLTSSRRLLVDAINAGGADSGKPLVVFTLFRLHMVHLASGEPEYVRQARACIDWDAFTLDTAAMADAIREHGFFGDDPFALARKRLTRSVKSPNSRVFRMHRLSMASKLASQTNAALEKAVLTDRYRRAQDLEALQRMARAGQWDRLWETHAGRALEASEPGLREDTEGEESVLQSLARDAMEVCMAAGDMFARVLNLGSCRSAIVNVLLHTPTHLHLTREAFAMLQRPELGGASPACVEQMCELVDVYHVRRGVPKEFRQAIDAMEVRDFVLACFYLNICAQLERITFVPLDAETVQRTDAAVCQVRHGLAPGQEVPESVWDVYVSLCCRRVCTLMGKGRFGNRKVAFDMERQCFVCAYGTSHNPDDAASSSANAHTTATHTASTYRPPKDDESDEDDEEAPVEDPAEADARDLEEVANILPGDLLPGALGAAQPARKRRKGRVTQQAHTSPEAELRKTIRNERKEFGSIPCGQPVLRIPLRGRAMVWRIKANESIRVQFCPQCGTLHKYDAAGFSGAPGGLYRCLECAQAERIMQATPVCAFCRGPAGEELVEVVCARVDPQNDAHDVVADAEWGLQRLSFCVNHLQLARTLAAREGITKERLWELLKRAGEIRAAKGKVPK